MIELALIFSGIQLVSSQGGNTSFILGRLLESYDKRVSPNLINGEPVLMDIGIYILEMHSISDDNMVNNQVTGIIAANSPSRLSGRSGKLEG